jgi:hypothetical protein
VGVAVGGDDFEDAVVQLEDGDVEGAAAEVVDGDDAVFALVEAVGERCGGGLVDQAQDFEAGDAAGVFGGLALRVVEVGGDGDDGFGDGRAEEALGVALELAQDVGGDFGGVKVRLAELMRALRRLEVFGETEGEELQLFLDVFEAAAHEAFDGVDGALGRFDQGDVLTGSCNDRRDEIRAVLAGNDDRLLALHEGDEFFRSWWCPGRCRRRDLTPLQSLLLLDGRRLRQYCSDRFMPAGMLSSTEEHSHPSRDCRYICASVRGKSPFRAFLRADCKRHLRSSSETGCADLSASHLSQIFIRFCSSRRCASCWRVEVRFWRLDPFDQLRVVLAHLLCHAHLFQLHVQLEDFFEQVGGTIAS